MAAEVSFREVLDFAIGGGWGDEAPRTGYTPVRVIRGTDFARLANGAYEEIPSRFEEVGKAERRRLLNADIVLEISGGSRTSKQSTGRSFLVRQRHLDALGPHVIPASFCRLMRVKTNIVCPHYAYYALQDMYTSGRAAEYEQQSTGISNFQFEFFLDQETFRRPPLAEQKRIAHILGTLDDKIELNRRMNATLEGISRALFKSWFVDFDPVRQKAAGKQPVGMDAQTAALFPDSFEDSEIGDVPKGWRVGTIGECVDVVDCLHTKKPDRTVDGKPLLQLANIREDGLLDMADCFFISEDDYRKWSFKFETQAGDCVITNVGRVGAVAQVPPGVTAALGRNMTGLRPKPSFPFPTFTLECLLSENMREEIGRKTDSGTILNALNVKSIPRLRLVIPCGAAAAAYEEIARPMRRGMEDRLKESRTLANLRDTLLPKLLSGEIRVPEVEQAVEEATK